MRLAIIVNPISGRHGRRSDSGALRMEQARRLIAERGIEADVVLTTARGHAAELARAYVTRAFDVVMAWGGDGTINEIAGPLIGTKTALAVVPFGSGDGFARSLGLPRTAADAFAAAIAGPSAHIDVGYLNDRHFLNIAGIGFDAAVAESFDRSTRRGAMGYVARVLALVWSYRSEQYHVTLDGRPCDGSMFLLAFANGREYGNHLTLAPKADPADGWLDAALVEDGSAWRQLWRARRLWFMTDRPANGLLRSRIRTARVRGERLICHVDGEPFQTSGTAEIKLAERLLRVQGLASLTPGRSAPR